MGNKGSDLGLPWINSQLAQVNPKTITGITVGACMPEARTRLIAFFKKERPDIEIAVAITRADKYELEFSQDV
jgi:hypothetical protein